MTKREQTDLVMEGLGRQVLKGEVASMRVFTNFWTIAKVRVGSDGVEITAVGKLLGVHLGDTVELVGSWTEHAKFGRQFAVHECRVVVPHDHAGVVSWLASRLPQLGRMRATALVERFGPVALWQIIEEEPERLCEVRGITPERRDALVTAYRKHRGERDRMVVLKGWGLSTHQIALVIARWGERAEAVLRDDPYQLIEHVRGFGFLRADAVAIRMGLPKDAQPRIRAAILHTLEEAAAAHGHTYVPEAKLVEAAAKLLDLFTPTVSRELAALIEAGALIARSGWIFLPRLEVAEAQIATRLYELARLKVAA